MRSNVALLAPVLALILSACAPLPPSPDDPAVLAAAEEARAQEAARTEAQLAVKKQIDLVARHTRAICVAPENRAYFRHTPCLPVEVTEKHLADKKLPTAAELRIAKRVFSRIDDMKSVVGQESNLSMLAAIGALVMVVARLTDRDAL